MDLRRCAIIIEEQYEYPVPFVVAEPVDGILAGTDDTIVIIGIGSFHSRPSIDKMPVTGIIPNESISTGIALALVGKDELAVQLLMSFVVAYVKGHDPAVIIHLSLIGAPFPLQEHPFLPVEHTGGEAEGCHRCKQDGEYLSYLEIFYRLHNNLTIFPF